MGFKLYRVCRSLVYEGVTQKFPTEVLKLKLRVSKAVAITASRRISEKQGMLLVAVEERDYVCGRLPAEIWEISAGEWQAHRAKGLQK